jgi:uncharacterized protein (DUF2236 family)
LWFTRVVGNPVALPLSRASVAWRVNAEPVVFLGGGRALLLQVAHPKVAAGVEQHSTYATDPWGRLFRTVDVMAKLTFAAPEVSNAQARMLSDMHDKVVGTTDDGHDYRALDPELLLWVWATLCETALLMYERVRPPLSMPDRERYYEEWKAVAHACGVPEGACPARWDDFTSYMRRVVAEDLRVTPAARSVAVATMVPPLPWPLGRLAAAPNQLLTEGLFPPELRDAFGFRWDRRRERRLRSFFRVSTALHWLTPRSVRELGMRFIVRRRAPLRFPWLQRRGAELTQRRLATASDQAVSTS